MFRYGWASHGYRGMGSLQLRVLPVQVTVVINAGTDKCKPVDYGGDVKTVLILGLLDDPDPLKKVDAMAEGPEKDAARAALPAFAPEECTGLELTVLKYYYTTSCAHPISPDPHAFQTRRA